MPVKTRREQIEAMLFDEPNDPELRYMLAMELIGAGDDAAAAICLQELINKTPDYPPAYHMAGRALQRLNRIAEAKAILQQGIPMARNRGDQHAAGEMMELLETME